MSRWAQAAGLVVVAVTTVAAERTELAGRAMGTTWTVRLPSAPPRADGPGLREHVERRLEELEQRFSTYRPDSELSRLNQSVGTDWVAVSPELATVAAAARQLAALTSGAFDPTVAPLVRLWGFGPDGVPVRMPSDAEVDAARRRVDWGALEVDAAAGALRRRRNGITLDLASMAKGFAVDEIARRLVALGLSDFLVQIGGDLRAGGRPAPEREWRAGIENPLEPGRGLAATVALAGMALSTSGNYRNQVVLDGRTFGHVIDPRSGRPVEGDAVAVSVIHESAAQSSAWATALLVLGPERGLALAREHRLACAFLVRDGNAVRVRPTAEFAALRR